MQNTHQCHQPCPALPCYSLNSEQKQHGLELLKRVKQQVGQKRLAQLRDEYNHTDSKAKQAKLAEEANRIKQAWC